MIITYPMGCGSSANKQETAQGAISKPNNSGEGLKKAPAEEVWKVSLKVNKDLKPEDDIAKTIFDNKLEDAAKQLEEKVAGASGEDKGWQAFRLGLVQFHLVEYEDASKNFGVS